MSLPEPPSPISNKDTPMDTTVSRSTSLRRNRSKMERVLGYGADHAVKVGDGDDESFVTADEQVSSHLDDIVGIRVRRPHETLADAAHRRSLSLDRLTSASDDPLLPHTSNTPSVTNVNDLEPAERAILVRRTRKLEKVLGEALPEQEVGVQVVQAGRAAIDPMAWDDAASELTLRRIDSAPVVSPTWPTSFEAASMQRSHSSLGSHEDPLDKENASSWIRRAANRLSQHARRPSNAISYAHLRNIPKVLVSQERVVLREEDQAPLVRPSPFSNRSEKRLSRVSRRHSSPVSPVFAHLDDAPDTRVDQSLAESQALKRMRRTQIAKLQRLLGTSVPAELIEHSAPRFILTDDGEAEASPPEAHAYAHLSPEEKALRVRRAAKMRQVFGSLPPLHAYLDLASTDRASHQALAFDTYRRSIMSLQYMLEHDPDSLDDFLDGQEDDLAAMDGNFTMRRKRASKLVAFFGEPRVAQLTRAIAQIEAGAEEDRKLGFLRDEDLASVKDQLTDLKAAIPAE